MQWHTLADKSEQKIAELAPHIDKNLRLSFRYWRSSRKLDRAKRLHFQLTWLSKRLHSYQKRWIDMQINQQISEIHVYAIRSYRNKR